VKISVPDPCLFSTDSDPHPDPRIRTFAWLTDPDAEAPDPALFVSEQKDANANKKKFF
jgi:hypothetical protein